MAHVDIVVNGKTYRIGCEDGQEERLEMLARMVDGHVKDMVDQVGQLGDARLLVMASLLVADELMDLRDAASEVEIDADSGGGELSDEIADVVDSLAQRVESIAARLEGA